MSFAMRFAAALLSLSFISLSGNQVMAVAIASATFGTPKMSGVRASTSETTAPLLTDSTGSIYGFSDESNYSLTSYTGTMSMQYLVSEQVTVDGVYTIDTSALGYFGSGVLDSQATVSDYQVTSTLYQTQDPGTGAFSGPVSGSTSVVDLNSGLATLPKYNSSDPLSGLELSGSASTGPLSLSGTYYLVQNLSLSFAHLGADETMYVTFPDKSSIDPVPEPSSLTLLGAGLCGLVGCASRRGRKKAPTKAAA